MRPNATRFFDEYIVTSTAVPVSAAAMLVSCGHASSLSNSNNYDDNDNANPITTPSLRFPIPLPIVSVQVVPPSPPASSSFSFVSTTQTEGEEISYFAADLMISLHRLEEQTGTKSDYDGFVNTIKNPAVNRSMAAILAYLMGAVEVPPAHSMKVKVFVAALMIYFQPARVFADLNEPLGVALRDLTTPLVHELIHCIIPVLVNLVTANATQSIRQGVHALFPNLRERYEAYFQAFEAWRMPDELVFKQGLFATAVQLMTDVLAMDSGVDRRAATKTSLGHVYAKLRACRFVEEFEAMHCRLLWQVCAAGHYPPVAAASSFSSTATTVATAATAPQQAGEFAVVDGKAGLLVTVVPSSLSFSSSSSSLAFMQEAEFSLAATSTPPLAPLPAPVSPESFFATMRMEFD